jgi:hypothetical protein
MLKGIPRLMVRVRTSYRATCEQSASVPGVRWTAPSAGWARRAIIELDGEKAREEAEKLRRDEH